MATKFPPEWGVDISFDKNDNRKACAYLTIVDYITNEIVYEDHELTTMDIPYVSGFLGFRELPNYMPIFKRLPEKFKPDVLLVDGFGILHHRGFGSASHIGMELNIPTIGIGKTLLCMDGMFEKKIKNEMKSNNLKELLLRGDSGKVYGVAMICSNDSSNPIYVSIGHMISLETSKEIIKKTCKYRISEPIRNSDIKSKTFL